MRATLTALSIASAIAIGLAGCGDDSSEQLDAAELISRADEICREGIDRFAEVQSEPPGNAVEAEGQTSELVEIASDELNALRSLRPPEELRGPYDAYLESRGRALDQLERGRDAAADRDTEGYAAAQNRATADQAQRLKLARAVGLRVCSKAPE